MLKLKLVDTEESNKVVNKNNRVNVFTEFDFIIFRFYDI
jgi:hypothetical protein